MHPNPETDLLFKVNILNTNNYLTEPYIISIQKKVILSLPLRIQKPSSKKCSQEVNVHLQISLYAIVKFPRNLA